MTSIVNIAVWKAIDSDLSQRLGQPRNNAGISIHRARSVLMSRGMSLAQWARLNGFHPVALYLALEGHRFGPRPQQMLQALAKEIGL